MKRVYLSGAMRGIADNNLAEFTRIGQKLADMGFSVMNPAYTRHGASGSRSEYLREDALMLLVSDELYVLPSWVNSPGARWEVATAWGFGIPVFLIEERKKPYSPLSELTFSPLEATSVVIPRETQYHEGHTLIGLCGFAFSGKDTVASVLVDRYGFQRVAFADPLKWIASECGWDGQKNEGGRRFLQDLGVGVRDHLDPDAWVRAAEGQIDEAHGPAVATDCRFPNELAMIRRRRGVLVWVERPDVGAVNAHVSEHSVGPNDCDLKFSNDCYLEEVPQAVQYFMESNGLL